MTPIWEGSPEMSPGLAVTNPWPILRRIRRLRFFVVGVKGTSGPIKRRKFALKRPVSKARGLTGMEIYELEVSGFEDKLTPRGGSDGTG